MITVKILGTGCPKCKRLEELARQAAAEAGINAEFIKVQDIDSILEYPITGTPGLVINEQVVSSGRLPKKDEIIAWLTSAHAPAGGEAR